MVSVILVLLVSLCAVGAMAEQVVLNKPKNNYPGYELRRYALDGHEMPRILNAAKEHNLDIWKIDRVHMDVFIPENVTLPGVPYTVIPHKHIAQSPSPENSGPWNLTTLTNNTFHKSYHNITEISQFLTQLAADYPKFVKLISVGYSSQGRDIIGVEIGRGSNRKRRNKLGFLLLGAQHGREWIATATALYFSHALAVPKSSDPYSHHALLDSFTFHIIPAPNPDGYDYTWTTDRLFYKSRQPVGKTKRCVGIDMNRNWGFKWSGSAETDPCSHWYAGSRAFESVEVNEIASYVANRAARVDAFLELRAYGQMLSTPFSYSCDLLPHDAEDLIEAAVGAAQALSKTHGTKTSFGRLCEQLYSAPGNVIDWMYAVAKIKWSYVAHLRDTGTYGFLLPPEWIAPVGEETSELIAYLARFIEKKHK